LKGNSRSGFLVQPRRGKAICTVKGDGRDHTYNKFRITFFKDKYKTPAITKEVTLKIAETKKWVFEVTWQEPGNKSD